MSIFNKLERSIFYFMIFIVPFQTRLILHSWSRPFNQWTSAYLYGTDILFGLLLIFWLARNVKINSNRIFNFQFCLLRRSNFGCEGRAIFNSGFWLLAFFIISVLSLFNSRIIGLSFYQLLKIAEFIAFYFYLKSGLGKIFSLKSILSVIIVSGVFQSVIGILQYIKQGSLGLRLLGESPLSINATGVAVFIVDSEKYLRVYGTTPHPNILAAWLFVAIFAFYLNYFYKTPATGSAGSFTYKSDRNYMLFTELMIYAVLLFGFFLTFSRVIIGLWGLGIILIIFTIFFRKKNDSSNLQIKSQIALLAIISFAVVALFSLIFWPQVRSRMRISAQEEAVTQRIFYNEFAGSVAINNPLFGVGVGQFIPQMMVRFKHLPAFAYQPVHNIYLLIASETGFIGLGIFLVFIFFSFWQFIRRSDFQRLYAFPFLIFISSLLITGLFDHFLWTSQQGSLIFWMAFALAGVNLEKIQAGI